ncbi:MAG: hypothetical protein MUQ43_06930 [Reinekea forsetii]|jgi:hypothetical protein|uniref:Uncharacterized protein n=1 Tax=Reinekea forsetii TaxID=1336806 RepID=A0A2K8KMY1_9GAMM|nr:MULTISPECIES: energy transducer TonB [Reinekea]ATX76203.1 hypothetical protein REIFOR_01050 [Reinekea forsetii]MDO7642943.1 hypothetical protein [Reinekea forsetii]MDO7644819.1 hypothetical protein [Reinekea forsetii]MDO7674143.1 hypothetical protein [Reinekea forsetii]|tara:strand:+ start:368 stop:907 length:540 start_codon:yes stop_codon:yes gene_type:complete
MVTLEIIDAGVKIAAGMLLSGLAFLYYLRRHQSLDSRAEAEIRRRRELFELVAGNVGRVHYVYQQYLALATEFTRYGQHWPKPRRDELARVGDELASVFHALTEAESTLLLLGEKRLERSLRIYGAKIVMLRRQIYAEKQQLSGEEIHLLDDVKKEISQLKESFFDALSVRYMPKKASH